MPPATPDLNEQGIETLDARHDILDATRRAAADALRYWEPRRIAYNAGLALVVGVVVVLHWTDFMTHASTDVFLGLFLLAVLANVVYCAAYPVDLFVQHSGLQAWLGRMRGIVFGVGLLFACVVAQFIARGIVNGG